VYHLVSSHPGLPEPEEEEVEIEKGKGWGGGYKNPFFS